VVCSGRNIPNQVDVMSLELFHSHDDRVLAIIFPLKNTCKTFTAYSSCRIDSSDTKRSLVRTLVSDLEEGETVRLGCNVTTLRSDGHPNVYSWFTSVHRKSKFCPYNLRILIYVHSYYCGAYKCVSQTFCVYEWVSTYACVCVVLCARARMCACVQLCARGIF
jgi:hypothetical protein